MDAAQPILHVVPFHKVNHVKDPTRSQGLSPEVRPSRLKSTVKLWIDSHAGSVRSREGLCERVDWLRVLPFIGVHIAALGVLFCGVSAAALWAFALSFAVRMLAITGFYHRYFAHRSFKAGRITQFVFALIGAASAQRGPLWWASHHRHHHRHSDTDKDMHSPARRGFWYSHMGWFMSAKGHATDPDNIRDWTKFPELRFIDRFDMLVPVIYAVLLFLLGSWLNANWPALNTSGTQFLFWGFFASTVVLFHATVTINSLAHRFGRRRYATGDDSRNNFWLALLTFGEGWHNNHHYYPGSARQGFFWWEVDITYYVLRLMAAFGLVRDLRPVPTRLRDRTLRDGVGEG